MVHVPRTAQATDQIDRDARTITGGDDGVNAYPNVVHVSTSFRMQCAFNTTFGRL